MAFPGGFSEMKLLTKTHMSQRRLIEILRVIESTGTPVGARAISDSLSIRGFDLGERAVRYNLKILDELGFTKKKGYSGRVLTPRGSRELGDALVDDRIGFVNTRIEEYMFKTSFDPKTGRGDVIANTSIIDKANAEEVFEILGRAFDAGYTISRRVLILDEGESFSNLEIPEGAIGVATICSITLDGMFMKRGIPVLTSFAGLAEVKEKQTADFTDLIAYAGSSLDPIKIFMGRRVTRVADAIFKGSGTVLANVREVPFAAATLISELLDEAQSAGFGGLIKIGELSEPILGCPVGSGKIGIAFYAGVNGVVAAEELGVKIKTAPISILVDYSKTHELK
ncbi:MAG TPA: NrpR regulatory domain-containing protein [Methanothrix sp.]|nr:NrpR regulatory domain-containing protein [Methanothrix sp.]